jgi:hypothetical protein
MAALAAYLCGRLWKWPETGREELWFGQWQVFVLKLPENYD